MPLVLLIIILIMISVVFYIGIRMRDSFEKEEEQNLLERESLKKIQENIRRYKELHEVPCNAEVVKYKSGIKEFDSNISHSQEKHLAKENQEYYFWYKEKWITILSKHCEPTGEIYINNKKELDISKINHYTVQGDKYATTNISGGGSSLGKAVIGGAIAGSAGAVIASREEITSTTDFIDERKTMIYYQDGEEVSNIILSGEAYDYLLNVIPEKEYSFVISQQKEKESNKSNTLLELEQLADLRDKGIITEEEFTAKKKQILGLS